MTYNSKYFLSFAALAFATTNALVVIPTNDATALANAVLGPGITLVSATYTGAVGSSGTYTDGPLGIRDSIVMTSGQAIDTIPSNSDAEASKSLDTAGSALCQTLNGGVQTYDAAVLSMDVVLNSAYSGFFTEFVFASEEYPEWVGSDFNDVFGIWIDGKQIAADSNGAPITINGGFFSSGNVVTPPASGSNFDGSTPLLRAGGSVIAPGAHKIEIAICDTADSLLDSSVFLTLGACTDAENCKTGAVAAPPVTSTSTTSASETSTTSTSVISNTTIIAPVTTAPVNTSTVVLPPISSIIPTTNVTLPEVTSTTVTAVLPIGTNPTAPIVTGPTSSVHTSSVTAPYGNSTVIVPPTSTGSSVVVAPTEIGTSITAAPLPTDEEEAPCVTYTSYITKTLTKCDQTACHATTTVKPTVVTSTLHLTVYTPCSTVTVSKCAGSDCVTYTNTVTYPAVTGYPPVPTFEAPAVSTVTPVSACTPGVNCPHVHPASSSGVAVPSAPVVGAPGAPASSAGVAVPSAPAACTPGVDCPHGHPVSSEGIAVPSAPSVDAPGAPVSSAGTAVPSAPSACTPGVNCPHGHPASSEGVAVPSAPATGALGAPATSAGVAVPSAPGAPASSAGVAVPSAPGAPASSAGVAVPSAPSACTPGVDCPHPASVTGGPVVSPVAVPAIHNTTIPAVHNTTTVSAVNSTTSTSSSTSSHSTTTISTKTTTHPVQPTVTPAGALFEGAANRVQGAAGVMVGLMVAGFVALF